MKIKMKLKKWRLLAVTMILVITALVTTAAPILASSPPSPFLGIPLTVGTTFGPGTANTYLDITLDGGPVKGAWCVDTLHGISAGHTYSANVYDFFGQYYPDYDDTLPAEVRAVDWFAIAYIINNKVGTWRDVQYALWNITNGVPYTSGSNTETMVTEAQNYLADHGGVYIPEDGGIAPMVCFISGHQLIFFEYAFFKPSEPLPELPTVLLFGLGLLGLAGFITVKARKRIAAAK